MTDVYFEKLQLINWLIHLQDKAILERVAALKEESEIADYESNLRPMSKEELRARAQASNKAIEEGRVSDLEDLENENW